MADQVTLLLIEDEEDDTTVVSSVEARVVHLSDFTYVNSTTGEFTLDLTDDLNRVASCAHDRVRAAGFERIATWLGRRQRRLSVAGAGFAASDTDAVAATVAAWAEFTEPSTAQEFAAAQARVAG